MRSSLSQTKFVPISDARSNLSQLVDQTKGETAFTLTRRGRPQAVLLDYEYWQNLRARLRAIYQKTFIQSQFTKYTREFTDQEIEEWDQEDQL